MFDSLIKFVREQYRSNGPIPLHAPVFSGNERTYVTDAIDSTFVSSVGAYVEKFEQDIARFTCSPRSVATVNGTAALHMALLIAGVGDGELVVTQSLTFVATCNAISYCGAAPLFLDVDRHTLGLSPVSLDHWLCDNAYIDTDGLCRARLGNSIIRACVPMHTFGHPADLAGLVDVCHRWNLVLVEDAAESLGSLYRGCHTGTFGRLGVLSFNGNKIITTGGGGMILAGDEFCDRAKYLTTTARRPHRFEYFHDEIGYNYRLPNINAALGCAQLEKIDFFIEAKRLLAKRYESFFSDSSLHFISEPEHCRSNYWLNAVVCEDRKERDALLETTNQRQIMTRPIWRLMHRLPMYSGCLRDEQVNAEWLEDRVVNLPSSVIPEAFY